MSISYMHMQVGKGRVTVAIQVSEGSLEVGLAFCSPGDQFCRRIGRDIATGRIRAGKYITIPRDEDKYVKEQVKDYLFLHPRLFPRWAHDYHCDLCKTTPCMKMTI